MHTFTILLVGAVVPLLAFGMPSPVLKKGMTDNELANVLDITAKVCLHLIEQGHLGEDDFKGVDSSYGAVKVCVSNMASYLTHVYDQCHQMLSDNPYGPNGPAAMHLCALVYLEQSYPVLMKSITVGSFLQLVDSFTRAFSEEFVKKMDKIGEEVAEELMSSVAKEIHDLGAKCFDENEKDDLSEETCKTVEKLADELKAEKKGLEAEKTNISSKLELKRLLESLQNLN